MKLRFAALLSVAALFVAPDAQAQTCADHAVFQKGTVLAMAHFNHKGKELGVQRSVTEATAPVDGGLRARIRSTSTVKGAPEDAVTLDLLCTGDTISVDMRSFVPSEPVEALEGWELTFEGSHLAYPATLSAGQALPDGTMVMTMKMPGAEDMPGGMPMSTTYTVTVKNRKVGALESVTTRAGTFDAWKVTYDVNFHMKGPMGMDVRGETSHVEWYVPEIGAQVKSETGRKGKLQSSTELAELQRG